MIGWCPNCQANTNLLVEETKILRVVTCPKCHTTLERKWKAKKGGE